jgi:uncharacterized RDD family membrane protein YckC
LGLLHEGRATLCRFVEGGIECETRLLPFGWIAETGAQQGEKLYVFGGAFDEPRGGGAKPAGRVAAAVFDGNRFVELDAQGPDLAAGPRGEFWIQAVAHAGRICVFWRSAETIPSLDLEAPVAFTGPLRMVGFDGMAFGSEVREFAGLPPGQPEVWSAGGRLRVAVQPQERGFAHDPPLRLFTLNPDGQTAEDSLPAPRRTPALRIKFFAVTRLPVEDREVFLRSNSQRFELWEATAAGWSVQRRLHGLPEFSLESFFLGTLGLSVALVATGLGLAFRRRRQMRLVLEKLRPQDVCAPISFRVAAYMVDVLLLALLTEGAFFLRGQAGPRWTMVWMNFEFLTIYSAAYMLYLPLAEWRFGASLGKWLLGLRVVMADGGKPTLWSAFARNLIGFFERHFLLAAFVALPAMLFTPRRQRVGDLLARTYVVQKEAFDRYQREREEARGD